MPETTFFDVTKVRKAAKKASDKGVAAATVYLWKTSRNSVKKNDGKEKKYELKILNNGETVQEHLGKAQRSNEEIVIRHKGDVRQPQIKGSYRLKKAAAAGKPPKSHKTVQPGWYDYWLKKGIQSDPKAGTVYLNPSRLDKGNTGRSHSIPQLIEMGGYAKSKTRPLIGYYIRTRRYKNGKTKVSYRKVFEEKEKSYMMPPHPFLQPALAKASKKLVQILKNSIKK